MRRVLITGATGAIGSACAMTLAQSGYELILHAHQSVEKVEQLSAAIQAQGAMASSILFDLTDPEQSRTAVESLTKDRPVDILIHSAGIHSDAPLAGMTPHQWSSVIDVSLNGFYNVTQPILMPMIRQRWGRIVCLSSIAGITGNRGQTNYAAAKAGLIGASKSLAIEMASRNILVNVVAPGIIESPMTEHAFNAESIRKLVPMGRAGKAEEVADLIAFLVSEKASYLTGQVIGLNGGMI